MRVLSVLLDTPFPATTGLHLRMVSSLDLVRRLGCRQTALVFGVEDRAADLAAPEWPRYVETVAFGGQRRVPGGGVAGAGWRKLDYGLRGLLGLAGRRYPFSAGYDDADAEARVLAAARADDAEAVILPTTLVHYAPALRRAGFVVVGDAADIVSDLALQLLRAHTGSRLGGLALYANVLALRTQERRGFPALHELWVSTPAEAATVARIAPGLPVLVVPNALDEEEHVPVSEPPHPTVGFIGTYGYPPNLQAVRILAMDVMPRVWARCPEARLVLAGAGLSSHDAGEIGRDPRVEILGRVPDSRTFFERIQVVALPIVVRGGLPLKLVEALARAKAIVAYPELVRDLAVGDGEHLLVRGTPDAMADAVCHLFADPAWRRRLGEAARRRFCEILSRQAAVGCLQRESLLGRRPSSTQQALGA